MIHRLLPLALLLGCTPGHETVIADVTPAVQPAAQEPERAAFVTLLGVDTIAVERFTRTPGRLRAEVLLRSPRTTLRVYDVALDAQGAPTSMEVLSYDPATGIRGEPAERTTVALEHGTRIPFVDMVHWPYELILQRAVAAGADSATLEFHTQQRGLPFAFVRRGAGRYSVTHPTRGTMEVEVDAQGRLQMLDAARTTRALKVRRLADVELGTLAARFAERERSNGPMGDLSGRGSTEATVAGAGISVDYGQPLKRGREIFGALVPYGRVWRTGANRATHFTTTRDLRIGETSIPAGTYTLFSIPRADGWTLIVNRRTDINGQAYDETHDLGRFEMRTRTLEQVVEPFTIVVDEENGGGVLRFRWDRTEAYVPFRVAGG